MKRASTPNPLLTPRITPEQLLQEPTRPDLYWTFECLCHGSVVKEKSVRSETGCPVITIRERIRNRSTAEEIRLQYLRVYEQYLAYEPHRSRNRLLDADSINTDVGLKRIFLRGIITDWRADNNHITRICLMMPQAVESGQMALPVDAHMWLYTHRLHPENDVVIHLGDTVEMGCTLRAYTDKKNNRRRFGVDRWTPTETGLAYGRRDADGRATYMIAPRHLSDSLRLIQVKDGKITIRPDDELRTELTELRETHTEVDRNYLIHRNPVGRNH